MRKLLGLIAFVSVIGFAVSLYLHTKDMERRIAGAEQKAAQGGIRAAPAEPKADVKPLEDKIAEVKAELSALSPLKGIAKKDTMDSLMNLAVSGVAPKSGPPANINKILSEQVSAQVAEAMKGLRKEVDAMKGMGTGAANLTKDLQSLAQKVDNLASSGAKAEQVTGRTEAVEKKLNEIAERMGAVEKSAGGVSEVKAKAEQANADIAKLKAELAALTAKAVAAEKMAEGVKGSEVIIQQGSLDTEKEGNDIKQKLRKMAAFRENFDKLFSVNLSNGAITVKPGYKICYFVSPADLVIPKASIWSYRRSICEVDENGIVNCTVVFSRGDRQRPTDEKGIVNFIMIACKVD